MENNTAQTQASTQEHTLEIARIIEAATELNELLEQETAYLKKMDIKSIEALAEQKMKLIRKLELMKQIVTTHPDILTGKSPEIKQFIIDLDTKMQTTMRENFKQITSAREINKRVMEAISFSVSQFERRAASYDDKGQNLSGETANLQSLSAGSAGVAINQSV